MTYVLCSNVLCVPSTQANAIATTVVRKTFLSAWVSSARWRIFSCEPLARWCQTELGSCMNPHLSLLCMLAGWRTSLGRCHSFHASLMATPPLPFNTSTLHDRSRPSNSGEPTVKALHHAGAAMFMISTTGCGTLAGPSLELEGFRSQKRKGSADSPGLNLQARLGDPKGSQRSRSKNMTYLYLVYTWYIPEIYNC